MTTGTGLTPAGDNELQTRSDHALITITLADMPDLVAAIERATQPATPDNYDQAAA